MYGDRKALVDTVRARPFAPRIDDSFLLSGVLSH